MAPLMTRFALAIFALGVGQTLAQKCVGQSCTIADLSGSTGKSFNPESSQGQTKGGTKGGTECITAWWKSGFNIDSRLVSSSAKFRMAETDDVELMSDAVNVDDLWAEYVAEEDSQACAPNIMIYARGTTEPGGTDDLGFSVGRAISKILKKSQPGQWRTTGVIGYHAVIQNNFCVGVPGGKVAAKFLKKIVQECPQSKIALVGYSQGAMVTRIGVAFTSPEARSRVAAIVNFGDPFNGAPIKGFDMNKLKIFCNSGDSVCSGEFVIKPAHLNYNKDTKEAATWIQQQMAAN